VENELVPPIAYTTHVLDEDVLICASPALPLFEFRRHFAVVIPPDTLQLIGVVPDDGCEVMLLAAYDVMTYCPTDAVPGLQMITFVFGEPNIIPAAEMPTASLRKIS
jgi:hypothetical protein